MKHFFNFRKSKLLRAGRGPAPTAAMGAEGVSPREWFRRL